MLVILCSLSYTILWKVDTVNIESSSKLQEPSILNVSLLKNKSIGWFRTRLVFQVETDVPINMSYYFSGLGENAEKILTTNSSAFEVESGTSQFEIYIQPQWTSFPSSYQYYLSVNYINTTTQIPQIEYEITQGNFQIIMGGSLSIIFGGVLLIGIVIIIARPVRLRQQKGVNPSEIDYSYSETPVLPPSSSTAPQSISSDNESGKIRCPECKKQIAEGSAFCPECGFHIPRFLRTKE
jgi:hypothetical protein